MQGDQAQWGALHAARTRGAGPWWGPRPGQGREARQGRPKGGRAKASRELPTIKALLEDLTDRVLSGDLAPGTAAVANQLINTRLRTIEQERRNRETEELEGRIEALERTQAKPGGRRWGP